MSKIFLTFKVLLLTCGFNALKVLGCETTLPNGTQCPSLGLYNYPDQLHCSKYYQCDNGCWTHQTCQIDFLYDVNDKICREPYKVIISF